MTVLLDTNVLLRLDHNGHAHQTVAREAIQKLANARHSLRTVPQVLYEYWAVATRPAEANGLGHSVSDAKRLLSNHKALYPPLRDERGVLERWEELVDQHQVQGKLAHDARLVAAMLRHGIGRVLTFNSQDFARFANVSALDPATVLAEDVP